MAVSLVGSAEQVQKEMNCSLDDFRDYCSGEREPTQDEIEKLIALIVREQGELIARNRKLTQQIRAARDGRP